MSSIRKHNDKLIHPLGRSEIDEWNQRFEVLLKKCLMMLTDKTAEKRTARN